MVRAIAANAERVHGALRLPKAWLDVIANVVPSRPIRDDATGSGRKDRTEGRE